MVLAEPLEIGRLTHNSFDFVRMDHEANIYPDSNLDSIWTNLIFSDSVNVILLDNVLTVNPPH